MTRTDKPRERALEILRRAEEGEFADALMEEARQEFNPLDSAFILELVYGTLRNKARLEWVLNLFSVRPIEKTDVWTRDILRLGAYQMLFMDRVPARAVVHTSVDLAKQYGQKHSYVNGLLRNLDRKRSAISYPGPEDPVKQLSVMHSHPEWLVRRWVSRFGAETTEALLLANNRPSPLIIRTNTLKNTRDELKASLESEGVEIKETPYSPVGLEIISAPPLRTLKAFRDGLFMVQDEAAQLISVMLSPKAGETVLDACAAPGGKATHIAGLMQNKGAVTALDNDFSRMEKIKENAARLETTIVLPVFGDATRYREGTFDKILIDAPCSGLGVLRRHPDGRWNKSEQAPKERQALQKKILENCAGLLKSGGAMVYATCTTEPEENENVISDFLAKHPEFILDDPRPFLPASTSRLVDAKGFFRTFPVEPEMDGFFGARMVKRDQGEE